MYWLPPLLYLLLVVKARSIKSETLANKLTRTIDPLRGSHFSGTLKFVYRDANERHLTFDEYYNDKEERSRVDLAPLSEDYTEYLSVKHLGILGVGSDGRCTQQSALPFVGDIHIFKNLMFPYFNFPAYLTSKYATGPTGFLNSFINYAIQHNITHKDESDEIHRNVYCFVKRLVINYNDSEPDAIVTLYYHVPDALNTKAFMVPLSAIIESKKQTERSGLELHIEYMSTDLDLVSDDEQFKVIFNLPIHSGCSEFFDEASKTRVPDKDEFDMSFLAYSRLNGQYIKTFMDAKNGLIRKEINEESITIWDLKENNLHHTNRFLSPNFFIRNKENSNSLISLHECFTLKISQELPSYYKPKLGKFKVLFNYLVGETDALAYIGIGDIRGIECFIYESVQINAPAVFGLDGLEWAKNKRNTPIYREKVKYIVTFYSKTEIDVSYRWWPMQITLHKHVEGSNNIEFVDIVDIHDFSYSLISLTDTPGELFSAPNCFHPTAKEQKNVELVLEFDKRSPEEEYNEILYEKFALRRFLFELSIIRTLSKTMQISQTNIQNFKMNLRGPRHLALSFDVVNDGPNRRLLWEGLGKPEVTKGQNYAMLPKIVNEGSCISSAALIDQVNLAMFCGTNFSTNIPETSEEPRLCLVFYENNEVAINQDDHDDLMDVTKSCSVYRFIDDTDKEVPSRELRKNSAVQKVEQLVMKNLEIKIDNSIMFATIIDHEFNEMTNLTNIPGFKYTNELLQDEEKIFDNKKDGRVKLISRPSNEADCANLCNLDSSCKSYSYCRKTQDAKDNVCTLANIDIQGKSPKLMSKKHESNIVEPSNEQEVFFVEFGEQKFKLFKDSLCSIEQRDYLTLYKQTNEVAQVPLINLTILTEASAFECARMAALEEDRDPDEHIAMFASCPNSNKCILNESLILGGRIDEDIVEEEEEGQFKTMGLVDSTIETCVVYRKKYQTFFHPSLSIVKRQYDESKQVLIESANVEECARLCWLRLGKECASFDYCEEQIQTDRCRINKLVLESYPKSDLEIRDKCLHYDRDLTLDKLREQSNIGRHEIFNNLFEFKKNPPKFSKSLVMLTIFFAAISLIIGLLSGNIFVNKYLSRRLTSIKQTRHDNNNLFNNNDLNTLSTIVESHDEPVLEMKAYNTARRKSDKNLLIDSDELE